MQTFIEPVTLWNITYTLQIAMQTFIEPVTLFLKWFPIASSRQKSGRPSTRTITRYAKTKAPEIEAML